MANGPMPFPDAARRGAFGAYDLKTNRLVWNQAWSQGCFSGSINTAGGLIFVGRSDGRLTALDKTNGHKVWEFMTDAGVNATASTFEHKGHQYVAVMSAGTLFGAGKRGDSVWLFSLKGKIESFPLAPPARRPSEAAARRLDSVLSTDACRRCESHRGQGSRSVASVWHATARRALAVTAAALPSRRSRRTFPPSMAP